MPISQMPRVASKKWLGGLVCRLFPKLTLLLHTRGMNMGGTPKPPWAGRPSHQGRDGQATMGGTPKPPWAGRPSHEGQEHGGDGVLDWVSAAFAFLREVTVREPGSVASWKESWSKGPAFQCLARDRSLVQILGRAHVRLNEMVQHSNAWCEIDHWAFSCIVYLAYGLSSGVFPVRARTSLIPAR